MNKLGVIGGMGPLATAYLFNRIVENTDAKTDQEHIDIIIYNHATLPDRTSVINSGEVEPFVAMLVEDGKKLIELGAKNIVIPCNTSHFFFDKIQEGLSVPVINMVKETVAYIVNNDKSVNKIGIMATDGTIKTQTYANECRRYGVEPITPSEQMQKVVMSIIYDEIKKGEKGSLDKFMTVVDELTQKGCQRIILACTELSYFKEFHTIPKCCVDSMDVLVMKAIEVSGKKSKLCL